MPASTREYGLAPVATVKLYSFLFALYSTHHRAEKHDAGGETIFRQDGIILRFVTSPQRAHENHALRSADLTMFR